LKLNIYKKFLKRPCDIAAALFILLFSLPLVGFIIILIYFNLGTPIIFKQKRTGLYKQSFTMLKFRTMRNSTDSRGELLPDSERVTKFGKFLRSTSLDELPELLNVIKGDMSLIGPRPLVPEYLPYFTALELKRYNVRPGLSGLAQVNGRNSIVWDERFKWDVDYVSNISFFQDLKIIWKTIYIILKRSDIGEHAPPDLDIYRKDMKVQD
jgi:undecaprenyl phosphate N,N'-diacetylbacillosamine 1-phosphate transferase